MPDHRWYFYFSLANTVEVETLKDWGDMYNDIAHVTPGKVNILVDMKNMKQCHLNYKSSIFKKGRVHHSFSQSPQCEEGEEHMPSPKPADGGLLSHIQSELPPHEHDTQE